MNVIYRQEFVNLVKDWKLTGIYKNNLILHARVRSIKERVQSLLNSTDEE